MVAATLTVAVAHSASAADNQPGEVTETSPATAAAPVGPALTNGSDLEPVDTTAEAVEQIIGTQGVATTRGSTLTAPRSSPPPGAP